MTDALLKVFLDHYGLIISVAFRYAPRNGLEKDIAQQVYFELLAKKTQILAGKDPKPFLYQVTKNIALREWRQYSRENVESMTKLDEMIVKQEESEPLLPVEEEVSALRRCLETLTEKNRRLIEMRYYDNLPIKEMGERLQSAPNTLCHALSRIRARLRDCIQNVSR